MTASLLLLLPIALAFVVLIGGLFWWAIFAGQFDDTQSGGESILLDDDTPKSSEPSDHDKRDG
ncbi:cbb3-type cytochrome oxidase assembly protein CcoS [Yanghanlia caeni]|uniref:Cbb3-type cytochrome oxidase assembly protein CcoS n=1 Tax=Yanghanlia caeni TaxID=3064283 RepID=A0ABU1D385_9BURK|nr:cbb3-type cytochrome oxidase assembly protein CcoS [Alcaligenaceae bacterium LG-2]NGR09470.1 cbb3-type cytochrome oxidase assembly protein CcoS [bacterium SGD-2]HZH56276.1 cbb3-type cytochrome oxidase assembly protein CcoS [Burkholderiaceae bacterium]